VPSHAALHLLEEQIVAEQDLVRIAQIDQTRYGVGSLCDGRRCSFAGKGDVQPDHVELEPHSPVQEAPLVVDILSRRIAVGQGQARRIRAHLAHGDVEHFFSSPLPTGHVDVHRYAGALMLSECGGSKIRALAVSELRRDSDLADHPGTYPRVTDADAELVEDLLRDRVDVSACEPVALEIIEIRTGGHHD